MQRVLGSALILVVGLAIAAELSSAPPVLAEGPKSAELGAGGTVKGDISNTPGEEDRIGVDLVAGATLSVKFVPKFKPDFEFLDPDGKPFTLAPPKGSKTIAKGIPIERSGRYEFRIAATDGTQGGYKLIAKSAWSGKLSLDGSSGDTLDVTMPAGSRVKGTVKAIKSPGFTPRIDMVSDPDGVDLVGPFDGRKSKATLPWTDMSDYGTYSFAIGATAGDGVFRAVLKRKVPKVETNKLDLVNGINTISYSDDGVAQVFKARCASCHSHNHSWAGGYAGARARAVESLGRIRTGNMPPDSRLPNSEVSLIEQWIKTGRKR